MEIEVADADDAVAGALARERKIAHRAIVSTLTHSLRFFLDASWALVSLSSTMDIARARRRHLRYGGLALAGLAVAGLGAYAALRTFPIRPALAVSPSQAAGASSAEQNGGKAQGVGATAPDPQPAAARPPAPWPPRVTGKVLDPERAPVEGASIVANGREVRTDAAGTFTVEGMPVGLPLVVKMPGYERVPVQPTRDPIEVVLKPHVVKAAYLTYFGVADKGIRGRVYDLLARTELNAVVIDVKGDRGWIPYRTEVPMALSVGAQGPVILRDFEGMLADLKARGVYTIARIVVFKDNVLANARTDLAIIDTRTGKPWMDNEKLAWVDPFQTEVWAYNIEVAKEAIRKGFDEVQFDYVRFPTDGRLGAARYSKPVNKDTRLPTVTAFLSRARRELGPLGVFVGADIFGYTAFNDNDTDIGQRIEELAPSVDYLCPMVYPSGYHLGIPGYRNPVQAPYQVVHESVRLIRKRANSAPVRVRPWIQDFKDYAFDRRIFGVPEIRAQMKGADEAGASGWMLWNPRNDYTGAALQPKSSPVVNR
jgi:hypothetical protein